MIKQNSLYPQLLSPLGASTIAAVDPLSLFPDGIPGYVHPENPYDNSPFYAENRAIKPSISAADTDGDLPAIARQRDWLNNLPSVDKGNRTSQKSNISAIEQPSITKKSLPAIKIAPKASLVTSPEHKVEDTPSFTPENNNKNTEPDINLESSKSDKPGGIASQRLLEIIPPSVPQQDPPVVASSGSASEVTSIQPSPVDNVSSRKEPENIAPQKNTESDINLESAKSDKPSGIASQRLLEIIPPSVPQQDPPVVASSGSAIEVTSIQPSPVDNVSPTENTENIAPQKNTEPNLNLKSSKSDRQTPASLPPLIQPTQTKSSNNSAKIDLTIEAPQKTISTQPELESFPEKIPNIDRQTPSSTTKSIANLSSNSEPATSEIDDLEPLKPAEPVRQQNIPDLQPKISREFPPAKLQAKSTQVKTYSAAKIQTQATSNFEDRELPSRDPANAVDSDSQSESNPNSLLIQPQAETTVAPISPQVEPANIFPKAKPTSLSDTVASEVARDIPPLQPATEIEVKPDIVPNEQPPIQTSPAIIPLDPDGSNLSPPAIATKNLTPNADSIEPGSSINLTSKPLPQKSTVRAKPTPSEIPQNWSSIADLIGKSNADTPSTESKAVSLPETTIRAKLANSDRYEPVPLAFRDRPLDITPPSIEPSTNTIQLQSSSDNPVETEEPQDDTDRLEILAQEIYFLLKRRLEIERERQGGYHSNRLF